MQRMNTIKTHLKCISCSWILYDAAISTGGYPEIFDPTIAPDYLGEDSGNSIYIVLNIMQSCV